ncbi:hypothetical protein H5410_045928 [Solanum commersonii]|uniref:Uncharacterized protein n=1 Tax=Solanum commersonii TaxID=4109 RepID=A0A9J5XE69_SOLCO|nr:hypothetical protein H5410_045928 [Solanum commersonii]
MIRSCGKVPKKRKRLFPIEQREQSLTQVTRSPLSLPKGLLTDTFARITYFSFNDLVNVKLRYVFHEVANETYEYQKVALVDFLIVSWRVVKCREH